jgi:hypothetical protein
MYALCEWFRRLTEKLSVFAVIVVATIVVVSNLMTTVRWLPKPEPVTRSGVVGGPVT